MVHTPTKNPWFRQGSAAAPRGHSGARLTASMSCDLRDLATQAHAIGHEADAEPCSQTSNHGAVLHHGLSF